MVLEGRRGTRLRLAAAASVTALVAAGAAGYAELGGAGGGSAAATAPGGSALTIAPTSVGPLSPQINPADTTPVTVTVDNTGPGPVSLGTITGSVRSQGGCLGAWFTVAPVAAPASVGPGIHSYDSSVILNDNDRNQTACASLRLTIDWAAG